MLAFASMTQENLLQFLSDISLILLQKWGDIQLRGRFFGSKIMG